jgi:hypothetical protein
MMNAPDRSGTHERDDAPNEASNGMSREEEAAMEAALRAEDAADDAAATAEVLGDDAQKRD